MIINHNLPAMNTDRQLGINNFNTAKSLEKLSSGLRINRAGDDAAGLAISEKMRAQVRGLDQASRNGQDGISLIQTAEGGLNETHSILQRMRELAVQSATDTNTSTDRGEMQKEVDQLAQEVTRISNTTEFNTKNLLAGGLSSTFQIGANAGQNIALSVSAMDAQSLGVASTAVTTGLTATNAAKLASVAEGGAGLASGDYSVVVTKTAAAVTGTTAGVVDTMSKASGDTATISGTFLGRDDVAGFMLKATTVDGSGHVTSFQYSTNGGASYNGTNVSVSGTTAIGSTGLSVAFTNGTVANAADDTYTFGATASSATAQLMDSAGTAAVGGAAAVAIKNDQSSATIGSAATAGTVKINFNFATLTASTTNLTKIAVSASSSSVATFNPDGTVAAKAVAAAGINISTQSAADAAITTINTAITTVSSERSKLGAMQNRLEHTIANLGTSSENLTAAESRVRDVDMAKEMMQFQKNNILSQAATAMLAQANQQPQGVLQLLR